MNPKILPIVAACGVLLGSSALVHAQQTGQRGDPSRTAASVHKVEKRQDGRVRRGVSGAVSRHQGVPRDGGDKTTGSGPVSDEAFADERSSGNREGRLRGDRGADMMDNVRRIDEESAE